MSNDSNFTIEESTFRKMLMKKIEMGFGEKSWDEWFEYISSQQSSYNFTKNVIEKTMWKFYDKQLYEQWVKNFALNLNYIWNESSAKELDNQKNISYEKEKHSAIVIGRGPSIKKYNHLELLANSQYKGSIVCCDGSLINVLKAGITPEKFPKFYVVSIDTDDVVKQWYDDPIVDKYGSQINGIFSTVVNPLTAERARKSGMKIHWLHALFDHAEGKKSFNQISALMVRSKNHINGLPGIQTGGNVGTSAWFVSWRILKCTTVALIGINHGWDEDDPWEVIMSHGKMGSFTLADKKNPSFTKLFPKIFNPEFNCNCILDPFFQYYSTALKEFISRSPQWVNTINATQGGCIFGERITCMTFQQFITKYNN